MTQTQPKWSKLRISTVMFTLCTTLYSLNNLKNLSSHVSSSPGQLHLQNLEHVEFQHKQTSKHCQCRKLLTKQNFCNILARFVQYVYYMHTHSSLYSVFIWSCLLHVLDKTAILNVHKCSQTMLHTLIHCLLLTYFNIKFCPMHTVINTSTHLL